MIWLSYSVNDPGTVSAKALTGSWGYHGFARRLRLGLEH